MDIVIKSDYYVYSYDSCMSIFMVVVVHPISSNCKLIVYIKRKKNNVIITLYQKLI